MTRAWQAIGCWSLLLTAFTSPLVAQDDASAGLLTENPLDTIRDELLEVLADAGLPFTEEQAQAIIFVLEESRCAFEQLFGNVMNFGGGPPRGEELDRALAGIDWMNDDFSVRHVWFASERLVHDISISIAPTTEPPLASSHPRTSANPSARPTPDRFRWSSASSSEGIGRRSANTNST